MGFKVGDRVVYSGSGAMAAKKGATATVIAISESCVTVKWDRNELSGTQADGGYAAETFELLKAKIDYMQITRDMVGRR